MCDPVFAVGQRFASVKGALQGSPRATHATDLACRGTGARARAIVAGIPAITDIVDGFHRYRSLGDA